jgi:acyl-CoA thioesterase FadM
VVLLFRVLFIVFQSFFRRGIDVLDESVIRLRVWPTDIDLNFHLNDGRYMSLTGLGRVDLMARNGLLGRAMKRRWYPVVGAAMIRFRREIRSFEKFSLHSRMVGWDEKWFYFEHRFEKEGALAAIAYVRGVLRTPEGAVPSSDVLALVGITVPSPALPDAVQRWREANIP